MARRFVLLLLMITCSTIVYAQTATSIRIQKHSPNDIIGTVFATVDGQERVIAYKAFNAWLIDSGRSVLYSASDGAGGYEKEGQSLWRYYLKSGERRKIMTEIFAVTKVVEVRSRKGVPALLVTMADGGLGATHVAVVNSLRGEVWRYQMAKFAGLRNGRIAVAVYKPTNFENGNFSKPRKMLFANLDSLLSRPASPYQPVSIRRQK